MFMNMCQVILRSVQTKEVTAGTQIHSMRLYAAFHSKQPLSVTLTLEVHVGTQVLHSTCHLGMSNTCVKVFLNLFIQEKVTALTSQIWTQRRPD